MSKLTIKYLSSHPVFSYIDPITLPEADLIAFLPDITKTPESWGHVYDTIKTQRTIQRIGYEIYEVKNIFAMNINLNILAGANHVLVETDLGDSFYATDIEVTSEDTNSRDNAYTIKFKKQISFNYELNSDFVERLHASQSANILNFKVENPSYAFNNVTIYSEELAPGYEPAIFKIPLNDLTNSIAVNDVYYIHTKNSTFNDFTDDAGENLDKATCLSKDSSYVYMVCSGDTVSTWTDIIINNLVINHERKYVENPTSDTVSDKEIEFNIYSFINPIYKNIDDDVDEITKKDFITYKGKTISAKEAHLKCWLKTENLYLAKYLRYAQEITLTLASGEIITPISKTNIIEEVPKDSLSELYEFDLKLKYEYQVINNNRTNIY